MSETDARRKATDRNALIAFILGMVFIALGLVMQASIQTGGVIALLGLVLVVLGIVFRGRR
jgi:1,4-dihydroxy-2-naphthoate octaprenyltransferase